MFFVLWLFFILLSGSWETEIILTGAAVAALVRVFCHFFLGRTLRAELTELKRFPHAVWYVICLVKEIFLSACGTLRMVWSPRRPEPELVTFRPELEEDWQRSILADSITLTPGTITVRSSDGELTVHCLDRSLAEGTEHSAFEQRLKRMGAIR